jgi:hypothetical protein
MSEQAMAPATSHSNCAETPPWWPALATAAGIGCTLAVIAFATHGKPLTEKTLTALAMPVGGIWLICTGRLLQMVALRRVLRNKMLLGLWLVLSICGTGPLPGGLMHWLESSVSAYNPSHDGDLDVVVVLGGGTSSGRAR